MPVYNLECRAGDGGRLVRAAGNYATVVSHTGGIVSVLLPSKQTIELSPLLQGGDRGAWPAEEPRRAR